MASRAGGVELGWGNCLKYLKWGWDRRERRGNKDLKKLGGGQAGSRGGCLKGGAGTPLRTMNAESAQANLHTIVIV